MHDFNQRQAVAQAIARIHWSIAYEALNSLLAPLEEDLAPASNRRIIAAVRVADEALNELRLAYEA